MDDFTNAFGSEDEAQTRDDVAPIQEDLVDQESQLARILGVDLLDEGDGLQDIVNVCTENAELYLDEYIDDPEGQCEDAEEVVVPPAPAWDLPDETSTQFAERLGIIRGPGFTYLQRETKLDMGYSRFLPNGSIKTVCKKHAECFAFHNIGASLTFMRACKLHVLWLSRQADFTKEQGEQHRALISQL